MQLEGCSYKGLNINFGSPRRLTLLLARPPWCIALFLKKKSLTVAGFLDVLMAAQVAPAEGQSKKSQWEQV